MKQKVNLKKVATFLLSSAMMLSLSSMAFTLETNGSNIAPVHAEEQVEVDAKSTTSDDVYTLAGSSAENNVYSVEKSANTGVDCSDFCQLFDCIQYGEEMIFITNDIDLEAPIEIPEGLNVTLAAYDGNPVEITGYNLYECSFFIISPSSSLTLLGNITLTGNENLVQAFKVEQGTLNLGEKNNFNEYPIIQNFSGGIVPAGEPFCEGGAIYAYGGTINIYNGHLKYNQEVNGVGGAIFMEESILDFEYGKICENTAAIGGAIYAYRSTIEMEYGTHIEGNACTNGGATNGVYLADSLFNMYGGTIRDDFDLYSSCAMVVGGTFTSFNLGNSSNVFYTNGGTFENNNIAPTKFPEMKKRGWIFEYWSGSSNLETEETSFKNGIHYAKWKKAIGYSKDGDTEIQFSSFEDFIFYAYFNNNRGTLYITNDSINLTSPIEIPNGMDITFVVDVDTEIVEIYGLNSIDTAFFLIQTDSSLTLLGNIYLFGESNYGNRLAFDVKGGTLNLGEKGNFDEYPVIQDFQYDRNADDSFGGGAIQVEEGTVNIYNARMINNYAYSGQGGAIFASMNSTVNFYNGEISDNSAGGSDGTAISIYDSTLNMYGGTIAKNTYGTEKGVYLSYSFFNMYGGTIKDSFSLGCSCAQVVSGTVESFDLDRSYVFYTNGGTFENNKTNLTTFPEMTREDYILECWSKSANLETAETSLENNCIYYAKWVKVINPFFGDIAPYRRSEGYTTPAMKGGYVFGGWYQDASHTTPIAKDATSGSAFADYVDAKVMDVKAQITAGTTFDSASTDMRIVSTVDSLMYRDAGFMITINKTTQISCRNVYTRLVAKDSGVVFSYEPTYFSSSSKYFTTYTIKNIPNANFGTEIKITPYWVTMDGTMVKGTEVIKTVNSCLG